MTELIPLADLRQRARIYASRARGEGTKRAYRSALIQYEAWCDSAGRQPIDGDSETVALYLTQLADRGVATATVRVHQAAIRAAYEAAGEAFPGGGDLGRVVAGIERTYGVRPKRKAAAAVPDVLRRLLTACDATPFGIRNRCMLLVGFGAALRRSEIVALTIGDVSVDPDGRGLVVLVRRSKTDQEGRGQEIAVHAAETEWEFCPMRAFQAWIELRDGAVAPAAPLFCQVTRGGTVLDAVGLTDRTVARTVQNCASAAGLDPRAFSGHSLRRGLMTAAAEAGEQLADLMRQSRHKSVAVALGYVERADLWRNNATRRVFR